MGVLDPDVAALVESLAGKYAIDPYLLTAHVIHESGGDPLAMRYEPKFRWLHTPVSDPVEIRWQMTSWGLLQVMGATARDLGFSDPPFSEPTEAVPIVWLDLGCRYFIQKLRRYGRVSDALSAYNAGAPTPGNFGNYVEPIMERADALREAAV